MEITNNTLILAETW